MKHLAPYQIFFPLGVLWALCAVSVWFVQDLSWFSTPTILIHSRLIMGGFLWSFITGFLMTAIPRMTGTESANKTEYVLALALILSQVLGAWRIDGRWFYGSSLALTFFLAVYGGRRILRSTKPVPVFFSHVGVAVILAFLGAYYGYKGETAMEIHLYSVGAVLLLVLGIGTRFFSFLSGLPSFFENESQTPFRFAFHGLALLDGALLFLAGKGFSTAYLGLAVITSLYLFFVWKVWRPSTRASALKFAVRFAACMIPSSFILCWLFPLMFVTWFHFLFIGCFALMTFSVATRVTLAHGSYPIDIETKSPALWWFVSFLGLALTSRILYGLTEGMMRKSFLYAAASFWILAILSWCISFFIRILRSGQEAKPAC